MIKQYNITDYIKDDPELQKAVVEEFLNDIKRLQAENEELKKQIEKQKNAKVQLKNLDSRFADDYCKVKAENELLNWLLKTKCQSEWERENEELKEKLNEWEKELQSNEKIINRLIKENEELKKRQITNNGFICDCEQNVKYRQALEEIRGICSNTCEKNKDCIHSCYECKSIDEPTAINRILKIISEVNK